HLPSLRLLLSRPPTSPLFPYTTLFRSRQFTGESDGVISQAGELRCCAEATVRALERVVQPKLGFELLGVKAVRAFDAVVVIVSLSVRQETRASRLVGAYLAETDPPRGAALAVLNATNRILGNFFATR